MKKFAVAMNNFDGDLRLEIIEAESMKEAVKKHLFCNFAEKSNPDQIDYWNWIDEQSDDQESLIQTDMNVDVIEL